MKYKEIEFKYKADNVSLELFQSLCKNPIKIINAAGLIIFMIVKMEVAFAVTELAQI